MSCRNCGFTDVLPPEPQPQHTKSSDSLVSQIIRGSRPLLDSDHDLLNADIVELDQLQSLYAAQIKEIQLHQRAVLEALANRKSIYAPIRRLPRDTLIEIFHSVSDSWWEQVDDNWYLIDGNRRHSLDVCGPLWVLARVCGLWRDTLHSSPASWARKFVIQAPFSKYATEIFQAYIEHTGSHLLNLQVSCCKPENDDEIVSLLVQSSQRWQSLRINAAKLHMHRFEAIRDLPALQTVDIEIYDGYGSDYYSAVCFRAPQLWEASLHGHGIHRIKLPSGITHLSGSITCLEDLRILSQLPNLRRCHLWMRMTTKEVSVVTLARLTHLYVMDMCILDVLSTPFLSSLTLDPTQHAFHSSTDYESLPHFLHRSRCLLETLSIGRGIFLTTMPSSVFALEACSAVSRLKFELLSQRIDAITGLNSPSILPNLHHLILCISQHTDDEWATVLAVVRSRRDAGTLKLVEIQFEEKGFEYFYEVDVQGLIRDGFEARFTEWDPPRKDHRYLSNMF
ncbi:hypothetical protein IW261DRAFT_1026760 [Armillaria novae-zelandiae]|uniref:F-box domain-containing protein n=1 Tax=Armillaria novae-zelandiae TaxID=153914 RepID=A0AA39PDK2_9AGAR|nr:hypothetical protein IW261DRAFT_1026760 [Armillaria novae-zelandiae]